jgi:hypothetical protein
MLAGRADAKTLSPCPADEAVIEGRTPLPPLDRGDVALAQAGFLSKRHLAPPAGLADFANIGADNDTRAEVTDDRGDHPLLHIFRQTFV